MEWRVWNPTLLDLKSSQKLLPAPEKNEIPSILSWEKGNRVQKEHSRDEFSFLSRGKREAISITRDSGWTNIV